MKITDTLYGVSDMKEIPQMEIQSHSEMLLKKHNLSEGQIVDGERFYTSTGMIHDQRAVLLVAEKEGSVRIIDSITIQMLMG